MAVITQYQVTHKAFGDLPGKFPFTSSRGTQYFLVIYHYNSNAILVTTLKNRTASEINNVYMKLFNMLIRGWSPQTFILDNETSSLLLNSFEKENIAYQLVLPHMHRRNAAGKPIKTWKEHFIAGLSSVYPKFPLLEWNRLIFQGMLTLNFLRNSRVNPKLLGLGVHLWHIRFQCHATSATGHEDGHSWETFTTRILGPPWCHCFLCRTSNETLSVLYSLLAIN